MVHDAEAHAEEDKKAREMVEVRNEADSFVYSIEKLINENQDKIEDAEKQSIEAEIANLKQALESDNVDSIREAKSKLEQASHSFAERIYRESAAQNAEAQQGQQEPQGAETAGESGEAGSGESGEKVYDADYEVVDDDKK